MNHWATNIPFLDVNKNKPMDHNKMDHSKIDHSKMDHGNSSSTGSNPCTDDLSDIDYLNHMILI